MTFPDLHRFNRFAVDTETTGLNILHDRAFGISISTPNGKDYYWDIRETPKVIDWLADAARFYNGTIIAYHASFDWHMLRTGGVLIDPLKMDCAMIRAALINEHQPTYTLDYTAKKCIGYGKSDEGLYEELANMFGGVASKKQQMKNLHLAPPALVEPYAIGDTRATLDLWDWQEGEIAKQNLQKVCRLERDLFEVVCDLEHRGCAVDVERAEEASWKLGIAIEDSQAILDKLIGKPVNVNPSGSLTAALVKGKDKDDNWRALDGTLLNKTATGKAQLDSVALRSIKHPAAAMVLKVRKQRKLKETFIDGHILGYQHKGRVHSHINQTKTDTGGGVLGTGTGRISMSTPALQQIHKRDKEMAAIIRAFFIAEYGQEWASLDYAQSDLRFFAHYTKSPSLVRMWHKDPKADIHAFVADLMNIQRNPGKDGTGANAKQMSLAQVFGMGNGLLAKEMGLPYEEVQSYYDEDRTMLIGGQEAVELSELYHSKITGAKEFSKDATRLAKSRGWIRSIAGRKMHFPNGWFAHKAAGYLYQSGTAEAIKTKMIQTWRAIRDEGMDTQLLLSVHDELNFSTPHKSSDVQRLVDIMEDFHSEEAPFIMRVPMYVDPGLGINWYEASC